MWESSFMEVKELMTKDIDHITNTSTVQQAAALMRAKNHGLLAVYNSEDELIGVISNKDITNKVVALELPPGRIPISDVMVENIHTIEPKDKISTAMKKMMKHCIKRLLVVESNELKGIITTTDIFKGMVKHKKTLVDEALAF